VTELSVPQTTQEVPCPPARHTPQERNEAAHGIMGRFAQESHTDLRDWYAQCLNFRALKRRLIDDPPDPYDDHPSMMSSASPETASAAAAAADGNGTANKGDSAAGPRGGGGLSAGIDDDLEQQEALLLNAERGGICSASGDAGTASGGGGGGGGNAWGRRREAGDGGGRIPLAFPDPASRVFIFEINEELERMWAFYRNESDQCASKLSALHDTSASFRHQLHRKLGGMGGVPEDFSSTAAAGGSGVGHQGGGIKSSSSGAGGGDGPGVSTTTTASLLDDPDLQYSSPVVSTGGVLRPTPQEHFLVAGSGGGGSASSGSGGSSSSSSSGNVSGATRIRGRRSASNGMGGTASSSSQQQQQQQQQGGEDENGWGPSQGGGGGGGDVDGGAAKANAGFGGGNCFMSTSGGGDENETTEDPYVRASLKRAIVELYDTCHRLLSFKMLNYDAFVRLMELHCRRPEAAGAPPRPPWSAAKMAGVGGGGGGGGAGDHQGAKAGGAVGGEGMGALSKEKAMKVWLLEQPLFSARDLNGTLAGAELLYASLFCNGDVDVARTALTFKASSSLRGNRRFDFGYRLGAATVLLAWAMWDCIADDSLGKDVWHDPAFKIYRGLGNLVLLVYMWGVNIWVWRRFGIDYERCLSLDPKGPRVDPCEQVWNAGCNLSIAFLVSFICFYKCLRGVLLNPTWVPIQFAHTFPLLLLFYMLLCFLVSTAALSLP
ncbi:unnamed protein product, partial [Ectocarpus fasciculatus]